MLLGGKSDMARQNDDKNQIQAMREAADAIRETPKEARQAASFVNLTNVIRTEFKEAGLSSSMHGLPNILR